MNAAWRGTEFFNRVARMPSLIATPLHSASPRAGMGEKKKEKTLQPLSLLFEGKTDTIGYLACQKNKIRISNYYRVFCLPEIILENGKNRRHRSPKS
jgi:hypothetical protein